MTSKPEGALTRNVKNLAADLLNQNEKQQAETIASGQLVHNNRTDGLMIVWNVLGYRKAYLAGDNIP